MTPEPSDISLCPAKAQHEPAADGALLWRAPGKLNLYLRVLGRREDGYHEIDSVVVKVSLYDELLFRSRKDGQVRLECSGCDCGPTDENLVLRAAEALQPMAGSLGADIRLRKNIPPASGMGGSSSDAAATLQALNRLWQLSLPPEKLAALAAEVGSDVPLFLRGPAARIRGRGERVDPVEVHPFFAVLYLSGLPCDTARVYAVCDEASEDDQAFASAPEAAALPARFDQPPSRWRNSLFNDLQLAAARVCPGIASASAAMAAATGVPVHLTGSGSALFILADDEPAARAAMGALPGDLRASCRLVCSNPW